MSTSLQEISQKLSEEGVRAKVFGLGNAGVNILDHLRLDQRLENLPLAVINTDVASLNTSPIQEKILVGRSVTRGLGAGGDPELARQAAESDREALTRAISGLDLIFLVTGLGAGAGTGIATAIADLAAETDALVVAFVTLPFAFEGARRTEIANQAVEQLRKKCHAVITLPNNLILQAMPPEATVLDAFACANQWIDRGLVSIVGMIRRDGLLSVDFATLRRTLNHRGAGAVFGLVECSEDCSDEKIVNELANCPLLHGHNPGLSSKTDALVVHLEFGTGFQMSRVNTLLQAVTERFRARDNNAIGAHVDEQLQGRVRLLVLGQVLPSNLRTHSGATRPPLPRAFPTESRPARASASPSAPAASAPANAASGVTQPPEGQVEFAFSEDAVRPRGVFENSARILLNGEDLDVPTYLRRGLRLTV